jgi:hypothetical protein
MPRDRAEQRVMWAIPPQAGAEEPPFRNQRLDRAQALDIGVDVAAAESPERLEAEEVRAPGRRPDASNASGRRRSRERLSSVHKRSSHPGW